MKAWIIGLLLIMTVSGSVRAQEYPRAVGLRLGWDYGLSYKHFVSPKAAIEGVATLRHYGRRGYRWNYLRVMGLYLIHNPFPDVQGLQWYYGGGASVSTWGGDYREYYPNSATLGIGIHGALGLDYRIRDAPISLTLDWIPTFIMGSYYDGFGFGYGSIGVRYIF